MVEDRHDPRNLLEWGPGWGAGAARAWNRSLDIQIKKHVSG